MPYPTNFAAAHHRHWDDAQLLFRNDRWANADQLYGLCAECGLKAVMRRSDMPVGLLGIPDEEYRRHVSGLWPQFAIFVRGRIGARYLPLLPHQNPFTDWSISDRYASSHHFNRARVDSHRKAARKVCQMIHSAKMDGYL